MPDLRKTFVNFIHWLLFEIVVIWMIIPMIFGYLIKLLAYGFVIGAEKCDEHLAVMVERREKR